MRRALLGLLIGCGPHQDAPLDASARDGDVSGTDEQTCGALTVSLRDFRADHPDFEHGKGAETGLVAPDLGADGKPMFAHTGASVTVTGPASFDQWYRDVSGVWHSYGGLRPANAGDPPPADDEMGRARADLDRKLGRR